MDAKFPNFEGEISTEDKLDQLQNYLYLLVEQMRYTTQNLDTTNMNQTALAGWEEALTSPIYAQIEGVGERVTRLSVTADGLTATAARQEESITQLEDTVAGQGGQLSGLSQHFTEFSQAVTGDLDQMQAQIDGQIQTWFDSYIPTPDNAPASGRKSTTWGTSSTSWTTPPSADRPTGGRRSVACISGCSSRMWRWPRPWPTPPGPRTPPTASAGYSSPSPCRPMTWGICGPRGTAGT